MQEKLLRMPTGLQLRVYTVAVEVDLTRAWARKSYTSSLISKE